MQLLKPEQAPRIQSADGYLPGLSMFQAADGVIISGVQVSAAHCRAF